MFVGRPFARHQAEKRHQFPRIVKGAQIAEFGGNGHRHQEGGAAHRLIGFHHRRHRPARRDRDQLSVQPSQSLDGILDRIDPVLEDDLLRRVLELLIGQPATMRQGPMPTAVEDAAVAQQKRQQLLALAAKVLGRRRAGANQVTHRFMGGIGHTHRGQLAGRSSRANVTASRRLVLIRSPGFFGINEGATNCAVVPQLSNLPIQPVTSRTRLLSFRPLVK